MTELERGPRGLRRGRGARERILSATRQLFRDQGINCTGIDQLCAGGRGIQTHALPALPRQGRVDRRTPTPIRSRHPARSIRPRRPHTARTAPRRLRYPLAVVPVHRSGRRNPRPGPPGTCIRPPIYKQAFAARLTETAREAGATNPEQLGEQLALLLDGAAARSRVLNTSTFSTAAAAAAVLVDNAIPTAAVPPPG